MLGAEHLCQDDGPADVAAKGERQIDQGDLIGVADGGQRFVPNKFSGDKAVSDVIELLKQNTAQKRQREFDQLGAGIPAGQVFYQVVTFFLLAKKSRRDKLPSRCGYICPTEAILEFSA